MNRDDSRVKIYACSNATRSSRKSMKSTKKIDTGATERELKIKIRQIRLKTIICPAVIFANNRIISANGFENNPIISTGIIIGKSQNGTPGAAKTCFQ
jgi:uncharacterized pyridoxamine 5'-phosphate oxidase family protein